MCRKWRSINILRDQLLMVLLIMIQVSLPYYAMTSGKITYPSVTIYQSKTHNIIDDPNRSSHALITLTLTSYVSEYTNF